MSVRVFVIVVRQPYRYGDPRVAAWGAVDRHVAVQTVNAFLYALETEVPLGYAGSRTRVESAAVVPHGEREVVSLY